MSNPQNNCYTATYFGTVVEGLSASKDKKGLHVAVAGYKFYPNYNKPCAVEMLSGDRLTVRLAKVETVEAGLGRQVHTLTRRKSDKVVAKVVFAVPFGGGLKVDGHVFFFSAGIPGALVFDQYEALVQLSEGEETFCFYDNGQVRALNSSEKELSATLLTPREAITRRIEVVWNRLNHAASNDELSYDFKRHAFEEMVDLLSLTKSDLFASDAAEGQELRLQILQNFFLLLSPEDMSLVAAKLKAALYRVDSALVSVVFGNAPSVSDSAAMNHGHKSHGRSSNAENKAAKAELNRQAAWQKKGKSQGPGAKGCTNPKKLARQQKKEAARK